MLHDADGNHSAPAGAVLAALVIAATLTATFPFLAEAGVDAQTQARLRAVAAETTLVYPPRQHCPADTPVP
ncbi:MAG TPA: hypothetical protein VEC19_00825 [Usitatibacter sp.]|nr:hypothetical protein [Usitatibacter sp.]